MFFSLQLFLSYAKQSRKTNIQENIVNSFKDIHGKLDKVLINFDIFFLEEGDL